MKTQIFCNAIFVLTARIKNLCQTLLASTAENASFLSYLNGKNCIFYF